MFTVCRSFIWPSDKSFPSSGPATAWLEFAGCSIFMRGVLGLKSRWLSLPWYPDPVIDGSALWGAQRPRLLYSWKHKCFLFLETIINFGESPLPQGCITPVQHCGYLLWRVILWSTAKLCHPDAPFPLSFKELDSLLLCEGSRANKINTSPVSEEGPVGISTFIVMVSLGLSTGCHFLWVSSGAKAILESMLWGVITPWACCR